jgi:hypothetical protein
MNTVRAIFPPEFEAFIKQDAAEIAEIIAIESAAELMYNLSAASMPRTGQQYEGQPRRSSINFPGAEFLQEQSGDLMRSVGYEDDQPPYLYRVGMGIAGDSGQPQEELEANEYGNGVKEGRQNLLNTFESAELSDRITDALEARA